MARRFAASGVIGSISVGGEGEISEVIFDNGDRAWVEADTLGEFARVFGSLEGSLGKTILYATARSTRIVCAWEPTDLVAFDKQLKLLGVAEIFPPGTDTGDIVRYVRANLRRAEPASA